MTLKAIALLSLSAGFLFHSCEPEPPPPCSVIVASHYPQKPNVTVNGTSVHYLFLPNDTLIFNYNGHDTLIYQSTDSLGIKDTIMFIGAGKLYSRTSGSMYVSEACDASYAQENRDIVFMPESALIGPLKFNLNAYQDFATYKYEFMDLRMEGLVMDVGNSKAGNYLPTLTVDGIQFYQVNRHSTNTPKGILEYYINKTDKLFYFKTGGEEYLKIN